MLEAQPLDRVGELDVDAEVVGVELELVAFEQRALLVDVHQQGGDLAVDLELPVAILRRLGLEIDPALAVVQLALCIGHRVLTAFNHSGVGCFDRPLKTELGQARAGMRGEIAFVVVAQQPVGEFGDHAQGRLGRLAVRRVPRVRQQRDLDRAIALLLRHLDLPHGAVLVVLALHDQDRHADMGERVGQVPFAELGIEPGAAPVVEGVVGIVVQPRELGAQIALLEGRPWRARSRRSPCPR